MFIDDVNWNCVVLSIAVDFSVTYRRGWACCVLQLHCCQGRTTQSFRSLNRAETYLTLLGVRSRFRPKPFGGWHCALSLDIARDCRNAVLYRSSTSNSTAVYIGAFLVTMVTPSSETFSGPFSVDPDCGCNPGGHSFMLRSVCIPRTTAFMMLPRLIMENTFCYFWQHTRVATIVNKETVVTGHSGESRLVTTCLAFIT